ncbi:MAG: MFS transporter [Gemmatimonadota bacterium]
MNAGKKRPEERNPGVLARLGVNRAVLALAIARMADGLGSSVLIIIIPLYVARLPSPDFPFPTPVLIGLLIALYGIVNVLTQPLAGALSDRVGRRKAFIQAGLLVMAASTLAFIAAERYRDLIVIRAFQGIGFALTITASMAVLAAVTDRRTRGAAMGVYATFRMIGFAIGPLVGGFLVVHGGFESAFLAAAVLIVAAMICVQVWVEDPQRNAGPPAPRPDLARQLLSPGLLGLGVAMFVMAADIAMMATLENEFNARLGQTAIGFGLAFSALTGSRLLFQIPLGSLSDRVGRRPLVIAGLLVLAPATATLGLVATTVQLVGARFAQGVATAAVAAPAFAMGADLSWEGGEARQLSVLTMGFGLGIAAGPLISGFLSLHGFELPFLVGAAMALAAAGVVWRWVPETVDREL